MSAKRDQIIRRAKPPAPFAPFAFSRDVRQHFEKLSDEKPVEYPASPRSARNRKKGKA